MGIDPRLQRRIDAMNDVFGVGPEQLQEGLSPADIATLLGRSVDSVTGAPTRAAVGAAITGEDPMEAAQKQFGANPDLAPSFGTVEDMVLDPTNLTPFAGKHAARLAALNELGAVGKYELANKVGNVIKAEKEFAPIVKERKALSAANKAAMKQEPAREGIELAFAKRPFEFPDVELLDKFKSKKELQELLDRLIDDRHNAFYDDYLNDPEHIYQKSKELRDAIIKKMDAAEMASDARKEKNAVKRAYSGEFLANLGKTNNRYSEAGLGKVTLDDISMAAEDGDESGKRLFVEAFEAGHFNDKMKHHSPGYAKYLKRMYEKIKSEKP